MGKENNDLFREIAKKLRLIEDSNSKIAGLGGFKIFGAGTYTLERWSSMMVMEDAVFTEFKVDGVSLLSARGMSGVTIKAGTYLPGSGWITDFTLSSGKVIGYR